MSILDIAARKFLSSNRHTRYRRFVAFLLRLGLYMFVTVEEAAEIYARACRSWYRDEAKAVVNSKIRALKARGDSKGVRAWTRVRHSLERQEQSLN